MKKRHVREVGWQGRQERSAVEKSLHVAAGTTSEDYEYTMEIVYCLGSCGLAPVAVVDDKVLGRLTPNSLVDQLSGLD